MKKSFLFLTLTSMSILTTSLPAQATSLLKDLTDTVKSAADIAKEAQGLRGQKNKDTGTSSWGGSSWGSSTGSSAWDWGSGTTTAPATTPSTGAATDPFADLGTQTPTNDAVKSPDTKETSVPQSLTDAQKAAIKNFEEAVQKSGGTVVKDPATGKPTSFSFPPTAQPSPEDMNKMDNLFQAAQQ